MSVLLIASASCAALPLALLAANLPAFRRVPKQPPIRTPRISVLIPARNEESSIEAAVRSVLANTGVEIECIVLDDHSSDGTAAVVHRIAAGDTRLRLEQSPPLPAGWCGKQHACAVLSRHAHHELLCFLDADVRLASDALSRMVAHLERTGCGLVSGFPQQKTISWMERFLIPLIHFVLLGFLPLLWMRHSIHPAFAAGCGQLMLTRRDAYDTAGGHQAIKSSLHDGITLPAAFRAAGLRTDIFDATDIAVCRMYRNAREVWSGLTKNASEGMASPGRIIPFTALLLLGQVVPFLIVSLWPLAGLTLIARLIIAMRFRQPLLAAFAHPVAVVLLLCIQWYAFGRRLLGIPSGWKDRVYSSV